MDKAALRDALSEIGQEAISEVNFSPEDREKAQTWMAGLGIALASGAKDSAQGYKDALSLMVAKYEVRAGVAQEKALLKILGVVGKVAVAALA